MNNKCNIKKLETNTLSGYKTFHHFENYGEIESIEDYKEYVYWAKEHDIDLYFLGNGSNTLFVNKNIKTLILKNKMPKDIRLISEDKNLYEVSSTVMMYEILNFCYKKSLDSFYFLASVPATIGGALAMNAGEGKRANKSIYDFVESVTYIDTDNLVKKIDRRDMNIEFRKTMFTGCQDKLIISATFKFPSRDFAGINPLKERIMWSKTNQDNIAPNCGSVFSKQFGPIMKLLKGLKIGKAQFSSKTNNWLNNKSEDHRPVLTLILIAKILHILLGRKCEIEVIRVK
ncbi:UDP-N-acetylenolpyruvoylglucosamine reductase [Bacillus sp. THAF10]|uniref:FAD-binding protein n=1 Tax=Bacillus sp. THAF10 TaxID=2587848 RepID=UPI001268C7D8|nr:FAD-binding protein [Bacillus sp. THAF10]QFT90850.1 UDP-N-acetylenolpyruvoylglucosamine reductase [Bacillus sp. THAF10]